MPTGHSRYSLTKYDNMQHSNIMHWTVLLGILFIWRPAWHTEWHKEILSDNATRLQFRVLSMNSSINDEFPQKKIGKYFQFLGIDLEQLLDQ